MYYWQIADGRVWSATDARFIATVPAGEMLTPLTVNGVLAGTDYLRDTIVFYGYLLGDLKTKLEKIQAIQVKYAPQLTALQEAKSGAEMRDDADDVADIKAEYVALLAEMNAKIREVPGD